MFDEKYNNLSHLAYDFQHTSSFSSKKNKIKTIQIKKFIFCTSVWNLLSFFFAPD